MNLTDDWVIGRSGRSGNRGRRATAAKLKITLNTSTAYDEQRTSMHQGFVRTQAYHFASGNADARSPSSYT